MYEYYPLLIAGAVIGVFSAAFIFAFAMIKDKKEAIGFDRNMKDSEIIRRLAHYARPHIKKYLLVFFFMALAIAYDIISPLLVGRIEEIVKSEFEMSTLFKMVFLYAGILLVSVPMMILFLFLQKYFIKGIAAGAVKG